jgi:hypothetical protein
MHRLIDLHLNVSIMASLRFADGRWNMIYILHEYVKLSVNTLTRSGISYRPTGMPQQGIGEPTNVGSIPLSSSTDRKL